MSAANMEPYRPSLVLIDDDSISREVFSMLLELEGYPVVCAESGAEALALLELQGADFVLMDAQMPGLSGVELVRSLRSRTKAKIVAISGSEPGAAIREAADGFLLKPIQLGDLEALLAGGAGAADLPVDAVAESGAVIDPGVLAKLRAMMPPAAVREIYQAVAADLPPRLAALEAAMLAGDMAEVARIAHAIKGGCAMVGVSAAAGAAARIESSNLNGTWPQELRELRDALAALQGILSGAFPI